MRRKDREITDFNEIIEIVKKCDVCRLALKDDDLPYIIPLNFGMNIENNQLVLYFHGALEGKKIELMKQDPRATFEMDCNHQFILYEERMSCTMGYESVIGHGTIEFIEADKKYEALKILMRQYHSEDFQFNTNMMKSTSVFKLTVSDMTGKRRNNYHPGKAKKLPPLDQ
ncbi:MULTISPECIES: pyridoxamine 5'-phosphate oxidase family protein [Coprobacillaceae]|uniref:pyridoxamine 5'-phosphate oxidase family protein n=1 Tax=Coprobacillaceae TaxID=2810280 RepID=UPI000E507AD0|nr:MULTISPECIES: pyridoxamine 5'-phosphate oxidase family protein [Coprobacillaceae]RHM63514.1 pyridoxamine 5'-phosphate oxidase family protein [Coprobacillus sp. AF33-1AC]RHS96243.1 pyridoxamine 5'-phosphate oxidase family protein [Erysipelatoclostridium sp. AM42-17]